MKNQLFHLRRFISLLALGAFCLAYLPAAAAASTGANAITNINYALNSDVPTSTVKLIFIHHSCGENWLNDGNGGLGIELGQNNYFVSDTNYGWGPDSIGSSTDIPNWLDWFRGPNTSTYMSALYAESVQHSSYTRNLTDPGGGNEIILFKSCFPNSALEGNPTDPPSADGWLTVGHAKYVYSQLLQYFGEHPDKLFVVITAPPLIDGTYAANARGFNQWLVNNWLNDKSYSLKNVAVFDFRTTITVFTTTKYSTFARLDWIRSITPAEEMTIPTRPATSRLLPNSFPCSISSIIAGRTA
jgi:hypothetical protein